MGVPRVDEAPSMAGRSTPLPPGTAPRSRGTLITQPTPPQPTPTLQTAGAVGRPHLVNPYQR